MISKSEIALLKSLRLTKYRKIEKKFLIEGKNIACEAIKQDSIIIKTFYTSKFNNQNEQLVGFLRKKYDSTEISEKQMDRISPTKSPSGITVLCNLPTPELNTKTDSKWLYLDCISDPGNLGTLLRSACWFGINQVALSKNSVDPYNPKVVRSGMGAHFNLSIQIGINIDFFDKNKFIILGGDITGDEEIKLNTFKKNWVLVLGNEAHGISDNVKEKIDKKVSIKKIGAGDSLNVSTSGSILMYLLTKAP